MPAKGEAKHGESMIPKQITYSIKVPKTSETDSCFKNALIKIRDKQRLRSNKVWVKQIKTTCQKSIDILNGKSTLTWRMLEAYDIICDQDSSVRDTICEELPEELEEILDVAWAKR